MRTNLKVIFLVIFIISLIPQLVLAKNRWPAGLPSIETIRAHSAPRAVFILQTGRVIYTGALLPQEFQHFQISDETKLGGYIVDVPYSQIIAIKLEPIDGSNVIGGVEVTTSNGILKVPAPEFYEAQPNDGSLDDIATLLRIDPDFLAKLNPKIDRKVELASGQKVNLRPGYNS